MEIHVQRGEERIGPLSPEQVQESLSNGNFQGNELAWHSGLSDWVSVSTVLDTLPNAGNTTAQIQQHTFNVTGCIFTIQPRQTEICQGDTIGFDVIVTCGEKRVIADEIYISLMESKTVHTQKGLVTYHRNHDKKILASNITMEAGESHSFEFTIKLPDDCVLCDGKEITGNLLTGATDGWCLYMHVENDEYRASGYGKATEVVKPIAGGIVRFMAAIGKLVGSNTWEELGEKMEGRVIGRDPRSCFFLTIKSR